MTSRTHPVTARSFKPIDLVIRSWPAAHDAFLGEALDICGCGRPDRIQLLAADVLSHLDAGIDVVDAAEAEVRKNPFVAADLILHWLYELDLIDDHHCLDTADLTPAARRIGRTSDLDLLRDRDIDASAGHILDLLGLLVRAPAGASLHSHLATAIPDISRATGSILLAYLCARRFMAVDNESCSVITAEGRRLLRMCLRPS